MKTGKFSISESLNFGWQKVKGNIGFFITLLLVAGSVSVLPELLASGLKFYPPVLVFLLDYFPPVLIIVPFIHIITLVISITGSLLFLVVQMGGIKIALKFNDNSRCQIKDLFSTFGLLLDYIVASVIKWIIMMAIVAVPMVPAFIWKEHLEAQTMMILAIMLVAGLFVSAVVIALSLRLLFFSYLIIDKRSGPIASLKESFAITKGSTFNLVLFVLIVILINAVGAALLFVGLFVTIPITMIASAFVYKQLLCAPEGDVVAEAKIGKKKTSLFSIFKKSPGKEKPIDEESSAKKNKKPVKKKKKKKKSVPRTMPASLLRIKNLMEKYKLFSLFALSGLLILASVIIYFIMVTPLKKKNNEIKALLNDKVEKLEKFNRKGREIENDKKIKAKEEEIKLVEEEIRSCEDILRNKDTSIEKMFVDENGDEIIDEALWKEYYIEKVNELIEALRFNGFNIETEIASFKTWENKLPSRDEINVQQKRFWIQNEIINIINKNSIAVKTFRGLRFRDKTVMEMTESAIYSPIPFTLQVEIEHSSLIDFIRKILNAEIIFFIETVNIDFDKDFTTGFNGAEGVFGNLEINCYALDFTVTDKAEP